LIEIIAKEAVENADLNHFFFINLGGYKENEFEEYHYKILTVAQSMGLASKRPRRVLSTNTAVSRELAYRISTTNTGSMWMTFIVTDILDSQFKELYALKISKSETVLQEDPLHIGYLKLSKIV
jgi:hypothetical protein